MKIRCSNPTCNCVIDTGKGFKRHCDRIFCSTTCVETYIVQVQRFAFTIAPFKNGPPINYKERKRI